MAKLGKKQITLHLDRAIKSIPKALAKYRLELNGEGTDTTQIPITVFDKVVPPTALIEASGTSATVGQSLSSLWDDRQVGFGFAEISPEQYGLISIHELKDRGHEMLSEFEIVDGTAVRRQFTRTLLGAKNIVLGGVSDLEGVITNAGGQA